MWLTLNVETDILRKEIDKFYTHIAFSIDESDFDKMYQKLESLKVNILSGRTRNEKDKKSFYFTDLAGHKFEFHTGTLKDPLAYYKQGKNIWSFMNKYL